MELGLKWIENKKTKQLLLEREKERERKRLLKREERREREKNAQR